MNQKSGSSEAKVLVKVKSNKNFVAILFVVFAAFVALFPKDVFAAEEIPHYATWEEAQPVYFPDSDVTNMNEVAYAIDMCMQAGIENYKAGNMDAAYKCMQDGYYGYYEVCGFERQTMSRISGARKNEVELAYKACRQAVKKDLGLETVQAEVKNLTSMIYEDGLLLAPTTPAFEKLTGSASGGTTVTAGAFFVEAFVILLREGLEAILVIGGIIAYLVKSGNKNKLKPVYIGSIVAIGCSILAAAILSILKAQSAMIGASQEAIEGITALIAVAILFYVSNWMLNKSETETWNRYINDKVEGSVSKGSMFALGFTAFLAVFREGAEVILFYQPMLADAKEHNIGGGMIALGVIVAVAILVVVFVAIRFFSIKLPLKPFFLATSILMAFMAVAFLGSGIKELLEGDVIELWDVHIPIISDLVAKIPENDVLDMFGIYPHIETIVPQMILTAVIVILFIVAHFKNKKIKQQMKAKLEEG